MKYGFDAWLKGADGTSLPVYCEVQIPHVGGQKASVLITISSEYLTDTPPKNPCEVVGTFGEISISISGVHWRIFPLNMGHAHGQQTVELLDVERMTLTLPYRTTDRELRFHLGPVKFLKSQSGAILFDGKASYKELFRLNIPGLGVTKFIMEWVTTYHRDAEIPSATTVAGFSAIVEAPMSTVVDAHHLARRFRRSLDVLSILFRQAITLHGWTWTDQRTTSTWLRPLSPIQTPCAHDERGDHVVLPASFVQVADALLDAFDKADRKTQSLARHIAVALNPHRGAQAENRFLFLYSVLERAVKSIAKNNKIDRPSDGSTKTLVRLLEELRAEVIRADAEYAEVVANRIMGLADQVQRPSSKDEYDRFFQTYPSMRYYSSDLWPLQGQGKNRGLKELRNAMAHGSSSYVPADVTSVAQWHISVWLERFIFVLFEMDVPEGIQPNSYLLEVGGGGYYDHETWGPLQSKPDVEI